LRFHSTPLSGSVPKVEEKPHIAYSRPGADMNGCTSWQEIQNELFARGGFPSVAHYFCMADWDPEIAQLEQNLLNAVGT
jgi:hypothetical protein